jgi:AcrR family transcriptional regulator
VPEVVPRPSPNVWSSPFTADEIPALTLARRGLAVRPPDFERRPVPQEIQTVLSAAQNALDSRPVAETVELHPNARERILESAYALFSRSGLRAVGIDDVIDHASVAKATLYRHFASKDELALAFLARREERWTHGWVEQEARRRGKTPEEQLLAIFDLFDEWFHRPDFEGCSFINVLLEVGDLGHPVGRASADHLANIRTVIATLAEEAGLREPEEFACSWHILMKGSIVQAGEGDLEAAKRAQRMARLVLDEYRT